MVLVGAAGGTTRAEGGGVGLRHQPAWRSNSEHTAHFVAPSDGTVSALAVATNGFSSLRQQWSPTGSRNVVRQHPLPRSRAVKIADGTAEMTEATRRVGARHTFSMPGAPDRDSSRPLTRELARASYDRLSWVPDGKPIRLGGGLVAAPLP